MQSHANRPPTPLLAAGVLAGPFFMLVATIQDVTRPGFHPLRCQVSQLAIGNSGWVQAINFLVTGALVLAFAFGLRQALRPQKLLPALLGFIGIGFMAATFFATQPGYGCPSGPLSVPPGVTINGPVHDAAAGLVYTCFLVAGLLCGRRAFQQRQHVFAIYSILSVVSTVTQIGRQSGQLRFSRPKSVRPVSVPSSFQQVIDSGVASQTNQAGTSPLKPGTAPPL